MVDVTIRVGQGANALFPTGQEIISSGSIVAFGGETISLNLKESFNLLRMDIALVETAGLPAAISSHQISSNHLQITLTNFNSPTGTATSGRFPVALFGLRQIYLVLAVHGIGTARVFSYSVYRDA